MASPDRHFANAAIFTHSTGLTPNTGDAALYIKSDNKAYIQDSGGAEAIVGGSGTIEGTVGTVDNAVPRADGTGGVTAQGSDINIDDADTTTQANVAITNQHSGETNSALVLTPKGTGALIAGPKPDGTTTGGNARGASAVDLQLQRTSAAQVASAANSALLGGWRNSATGSSGVVCGGRDNTASGSYGIVIGGLNSQASGNSAIAGGVTNVASGSFSTTIGGRENTSNANYSSSIGYQALADRHGAIAHCAGRFAVDGDAQRARFVMRNKTTTDSAVELFLDGSSTRLTIPSGKYLTGTINIAGIKSDGSAAASYIRQFSIKNVSATTSLVGTVNTIGTDEAASTSISITADDTNDALKVEVTGIAAETWRWVASVDVVEVAYGT